jgi:hypothetical protein
MAITYCLVCNITGEKYYGSSTMTLEKRMSFHKSKSNRCCSRHIILRGDYDAYLLHEYETIEEAEMKEDWYIDNKKCINQQRVCLTDEEKKQYGKQYYENNIEKKKQKNKIYYEKNKEKNKQNRENNREQISEYHKEYYLKNREKNREYHKEYQKKYYLKNREKINEKAREKVQCELCGIEMNKGSVYNHKKRHQKLFHFNAVFTN